MPAQFASSSVRWAKLSASNLVAAVVLTLGFAGRASAANIASGQPWLAHVIDNTSRGADGTKLADLNGDGLPDITTGWEEGGESRVYLHPGYERVRSPWPRVTVGKTNDAEDSVFADLDGDGHADIVSSTEGDTRRLFVQWAPAEAAHILAPERWTSAVFPATDGLTRWMFAEPGQLDGRYGLDLVVGGKFDRAKPEIRSVIGWLEAPAKPRDVAAWRWHPFTDAGWIMSILLEDLDGDGDFDLLFSDRYGVTRGVFWLENPGANETASGAAWAKHRVGATDADQIMFLSVGDIDGDGLRDIAVGIKPTRANDDTPNAGSEVLWFRRLDPSGLHWVENAISFPLNVGGAKAVAIGDLDSDGRADLVVSCESATGDRVGVFGLRQEGDATAPSWRPFDISGAPGIKYDLVRLLDLDGDGDLDVLTNEEREGGPGLGVLWYENPLQK